jgi:hypothetical protein
MSDSLHVRSHLDWSFFSINIYIHQHIHSQRHFFLYSTTQLYAAFACVSKFNGNSLIKKCNHRSFEIVHLFYSTRLLCNGESFKSDEYEEVYFLDLWIQKLCQSVWDRFDLFLKVTSRCNQGTPRCRFIRL